MNKYFERRPLQILLMGLPLVFYLITTAQGPLNPDAGEIILTAMNGGVLHPPGFPLQAWVNRLVGLIFHDRTSLGLLLTNYIFHCLSLGLLYQIGKIFKINSLVIILGILLYQIIPVVWLMTIQVEKYTFLNFLFLLVIYTYLKSEHSFKSFIIFSICWSLCFSHHYFALILIPLIIHRFIQFGVKKTLSSLLVMITIISLFYSSLILLSSPELYPDWGKLKDFTGVFDHMLRKGISTDKNLFQFISINSKSTPYYIYESFQWTFFIQLIFLLIGLSKLKSKNIELKILFITLVCSLLFLSLFNYTPNSYNQYWDTYLRRYTNCFHTIGAIFIFIGLDLAYKKLHSNFIFPLGITLFCVIFSFYFKTQLNTQGYSLVDIYNETLSQQLPPKSFYLGNSDEQILYGLPSSSKKRRFPLRDSQEKWYLKEVIPLLEHRLAPKGGMTPTNIHLPSLAKMITQNKGSVATTTPTIYSNNVEYTRQGLLWVTNPSPVFDIKQNITQACLLLQKRKIPLNHFFQEYEFFLFNKIYTMIKKDCSQAFKNKCDHLQQEANWNDIQLFCQKIATQ